MPQSAWKVGIVEEVIKGTDGNIRGAVIRVQRTKSLIKRPVNRSYLIEHHRMDVLKVLLKVTLQITIQA